MPTPRDSRHEAACPTEMRVRSNASGTAGLRCSISPSLRLMADSEQRNLSSLPFNHTQCLHWEQKRRGRSRSAGEPKGGNGHGGWKLSHSQACYFLDLGLVRAMTRMMGRGSSLTELGAGFGCYTAMWARASANVVAAVDGLLGVTRLTRGRVVEWDLVCPLHATADWVVTLEVAEHIPLR